jgi:hypothetical protein
VAHLWDNHAQLPDEKSLYAATYEAWKEYKAIDVSLNPNLVVYPPRGTIIHAFELRDV